MNLFTETPPKPRLHCLPCADGALYGRDDPHWACYHSGQPPATIQYEHVSQGCLVCHPSPAKTELTTPAKSLA